MKKFVRILLAVLMICTVSLSTALSATSLTTTAQAAEYSGLNYKFVYDTDYYYEHNPDVAAALGYHSTALYKHFLQFGMKEGRVASANFNVQVYKACNKDLQEAFGDNYADYFTHYLTFGKDEGRKVNGYFYDGLEYSAVFDPEYYYAHNADVAAAYGNDPDQMWFHFLDFGINEGRSGNADFDVLAYKAANADLRTAFGNDLSSYVRHYIVFGQYENRVTQAQGAVYHDGMDYSAIYNKDYYLANNPDVEEAFGSDDAAVFSHFLNFGMNEARKSSGNFDVFSYRDKYQDLQDAYGTDWKMYYLHYLNFGKAEGRNASAESSSHVHHYVVTAHTDPTCTSEGSTTYRCDCGNEYTEAIPASEHDWQLISGNGSTVKTLIYQCSVCKEQKTEPNPNYVAPGISCWGDSMTYGQYGNGTTYPNTLESLTGIDTYNLGVSGETSVQIVTRQGGIAMVTGEDITIPKGGSTEFSLINTYTGEEAYIDPNHDGEGDYSGYNYAEYFDNMCYINGQAYEIQYIDGRHYIIDSYNADSDSNTIHIAAGTRVFTKASVDRANDILVLEIGSNGGWNNDYDTLVDQYRMMIDSVGCDNYIILGDTDDPGESADANQDEFEPGDGMDDTLWESALSGAFGRHFLNVRTYLIENGLSDNGLTPTEEDEERASIGKISLQLRTDYDNTHLCGAGYYSKGLAVYKKGVSLGYW